MQYKKRIGFFHFCCVISIISTSAFFVYVLYNYFRLTSIAPEDDLLGLFISLTMAAVNIVNASFGIDLVNRFNHFNDVTPSRKNAIILFYILELIVQLFTIILIYDFMGFELQGINWDQLFLLIVLFIMLLSGLVRLSLMFGVIGIVKRRGNQEADIAQLGEDQN